MRVETWLIYYPHLQIAFILMTLVVTKIAKRHSEAKCVETKLMFTYNYATAKHVLKKNYT